jgi:hypothetical protein
MPNRSSSLTSHVNLLVTPPTPGRIVLISARIS